MEPKPFDIIHAPLSGASLIESGAGTGKTYTIASLFLRLILEREMSVEQILVVTFTKAATEELKERIRRKLLDAKIFLATGRVNDPLLGSLIRRQPDPHDCERRILDALSDFDTAAIHTIHGFCQRLLFEHTFETGSLFSTEVTTETCRMLQAVVDDFWRKHIYDIPPEVIRYAFHEGGLKNPSVLLDLLQRFDRSDMHILPSPKRQPLHGLKPFRKHLSKIRSDWPFCRDICARLLADPVLKANIYGSLETGARQMKILMLLEEMDRLVDASNIGFPLFTGFENLTSRKLAQSTKKGQIPPVHPFFERCTELSEKGEVLKKEVQQYLLNLKVRMFPFAAGELRLRKNDENVHFFPDLLLRVKQALDPPGGLPLIRSIRNRYKAALVDEFQDTDAVQYQIFSRLFSQNDGILFMIGDPKQAIYGFRGADIFSYLHAVQDTDRRYTLTVNWRSEEDLITAVNTIYSNIKAPFVFPEITFTKGTPGRHPKRPVPEEESALSLWYLDSTTEKSVTKTEAVPRIAAYVAEEIVALIGNKGRMRPESIAVLVRTNRQARIVKTALAARAVPAVLYQTGNIFDTHEALEFERVLASLSEPRNDRRFRAALATDIMGISGEAIASAEIGNPALESLHRNFQEYHDAWRTDGFVRMFRLFLSREKVRDRLLSYPDGERRLTNLLHLEELLQRISVQRRLGITGLIKWLAEQRDPDTPRLEEHQLRLESDAHAVNIATVHKSKGLEYDTVFCPYTWEGSTISGHPVMFHRPDASRRICLDLGSEAFEDHKRVAQDELLSENLRLLYVALTRAKRKCYLVWGRIRGTETSALAYLFHYDAAAPHSDVVSNLHRQMRAKKPDQLMADIRKVVRASDGTISLLSLPDDTAGSNLSPPEQRVPLFGRRFTGRIQSKWRISSYSSLIYQHDTESPDRDAHGFHDPLDAGAAMALDIFSFPRGVRSGLFFHDIFENVNPAGSAEDLKTVVRAKLSDYGFDILWEETVFEMIQQVFSVALPAGDAFFSLADVGPENRIHEMEFYFPMTAVTPKKLQDIFSLHGTHCRIPDGFPERLGRLIYSPTAGYMKGFIDLVFSHEGKYFLIDWKSNYLGDRIEDYHQDALIPVMMEGYYFLQYYLYTLALDRYLARRVPGYRYEIHFGGVYYLFLRGIDGARGAEFGIFKDVPDRQTIDALRRALFPEPWQ